MSAKLSKLPISVLDFCPIREGETPRDALLQATELAAHVEELGYHRFWVAEHHNAPMVASSATPVVIAHIASHTRSIRVGAGGVMLPNHVPLIVAEQFGTLASLHPGRIDLGLGRAVGAAPGREAIVTRALRLAPEARERYPSDVRELQSYFRAPAEGQEVQAVPGSGLQVPLWLLGSSTFSAAEAGTLGLPFVFATQIAPHLVGQALAEYRSNFRASDQLERPYAAISVVVIAADDDATAQYLFTSLQLMMLARLRGTPGPLQRPVADIETVSTVEERAALAKALPLAVVGAPDRVFGELDRLIAETAADELTILTLIYDQVARQRSFEILASRLRQSCAGAAASG
ncbi:LLM class flavin-dependent oxidoreductase [Bradyrhizobium sp. HKCCYLS1011]|uniref:LLM class flavin-dependent oxidoreductase n=1 Tax=Bradyrhizobium sp. HKCCYLS1011 TaxID=3420733 RepID=UPI003EB9DE40